MRHRRRSYGEFCLDFGDVTLVKLDYNFARLCNMVIWFNARQTSKTGRDRVPSLLIFSFWILRKKVRIP